MLARAYHQPDGTPPYHPFPLPGDRPHYAPDRVADIRHLRLEIPELDLDRGSLRGVCTTTFAALNDGLDAITFDAVEMDIASVQDTAGAPLPYEYDGTRLHVRLPRPLREGEEAAVTVAYRAMPRRGLYFIGPDEAYPQRPRQVWSQGEDEDNRHWFPCYDAPNERQTSELIVTVPRGMVALSNGRLLSTREDPAAGTVTYHWLESVPHPAYLISLAVGEFSELRHEVDGLPVVSYVQRGREAEAERALARTPDMLRFFTERLRYPYPFEKYAQVFVAEFIFGGMENTSATTLTDTVLYDERAALDFDCDGLVAHELAHQWFGDLLTCRDWAHAWLNEGFATYWEALFTEHHKGQDEFRYELWRNARAYFDEDRQRYRRPIVQRVYHEPMDIFDRHLYEKGGLVLHMLRFVLGDALFFKAMHHYVATYAHQAVTTADLQRAVEDATGKSLAWFFEQWLEKGGHPVFEVSWSWDEERRQATVTVRQTQPTDNLTPLFRMPVDLAFHTEGQGVVILRVQVEEREHRFTVPLPERPWLVAFDPGNWLLKTLTFEKPEPELITQLRRDPDAIGRIQAAHDLGRKGTRAALEALAAAVREDPFWGVQAEAARALGQMKTAAARDALIGLISIPHPKARRAVVEALGEFRGDERAADALLPVLQQGDPSYAVEGEAAKSLGRVRSSRAFDALTAALREKDSWNETIRQRVLEGLGELGDLRAVPLVLEWAAYGKPTPARVAAVGALEKLARGERKDEVVERLVELLDDPNLRVTLRAVAALRAVRAEQALPALERLAARHLDGRVVRQAREAVRAIRAGSEQAEELRRLRDRVDALERENRELRDRLSALEQKLA
jgi:aminopeptidase N